MEEIDQLGSAITRTHLDITRDDHSVLSPASGKLIYFQGKQLYQNWIVPYRKEVYSKSKEFAPL